MKTIKIKTMCSTGCTHIETRSEEVMQAIIKRIALRDDYEFTTHLIVLPYFLDGVPQGELIYNTDKEVAWFAQFNFLISRYEIENDNVVMYGRKEKSHTDRRGFHSQRLREQPIQCFDFQCSSEREKRQRIIRMIARFLYDFGEVAINQTRIIPLNAGFNQQRNIAL